ncbi:MAG TPA: Trk system potassium transporter TrkA [Bacillota bacterium]|nr:Trk system potassium transporter TrkA [Bacillota bacterium]
MKIVIVGVGKVGYALASQLQREGHDITVIDTNEQVIEKTGNSLDVIGFVGNGASYTVLQSVGVEKCDLLLAVAASDEVNMLCCLLAHKLGAKYTVARVRNPEYADQLDLLKDDLGLSMTVNPERSEAKEINRILRFPSATRVELFAHGKAEMVAAKVPENSVLDGLQLKLLPSKFNVHLLICAVEHAGEVIIPTGNFTINAGDTLYIAGAPSDLVKAFRRVHLLTHPSRNVIITGGGRITYYLSEMLLKDGVSVKIIEQDQKRAQELAALLPAAVVLHGDASDYELLTEEGLSEADALVTLTGVDEANILTALFAGEFNVPKVIAKVNNDNLSNLLKDSTLQTIVSPKQITSNQILRFARALAAGLSNENIMSLYKIIGGKAEILEFLAPDEGTFLNVPLKDLHLKKNTLIACLVRNGKTIIPDGTVCILPKDAVLIVTVDQQLRELKGILEE